MQHAFDDRYLGSKSSDPTVDNDGATLLDGAMYFNTTNNVTMVYDLGGTSWGRTIPTAADQTNIDTVSGISANVTTVAGVASNVTTVAGISANVTTVAGISANTTTVAGIAANVTTVAGDTADIATVATNIASVNTVATDIVKVVAVANDLAEAISEIETVADDLNEATSEIDTVANAITNVNLVGGSITNVNTVATNISSVNSFANTYRIASSAPSTSLDSGDLYFDTATDVLKVYGSSGWQSAGSSVNGTSERKDYIVGTTSGSYTGSTTVFPATYDAGYVDVYLNGVKLAPTDFTATSGTQVVLGSAATTGVPLAIVGYGTFSVATVALNDLTTVDAASPTNGQHLVYNTTSSKWEAAEDNSVAMAIALG